MYWYWILGIAGAIVIAIFGGAVPTEANFAMIAFLICATIGFAVGDLKEYIDKSHSSTSEADDE